MDEQILSVIMMTTANVRLIFRGDGKESKEAANSMCSGMLLYLLFSNLMSATRLYGLNGGHFSTSVQVRELVLKFDSRNFYVMFKKRTGDFIGFKTARRSQMVLDPIKHVL